MIRIVGIWEEIAQQKLYQAELIEAGEAAEAANRAKACRSKRLCTAVGKS